MKSTRFSRKMWELSTFEEVSYDKENQIFSVYFFDGSLLELYKISEKRVFEFVISSDKEAFLKDNLLKEYPSFIYNQKTFLPC
ncbi:hypothetical protein [Pontibacillus yanchengensis]|uniref:KTSC domain-containing protein n=1 Tax=Pontibacillus yanchengensis Y32 TaxID=1385514 RepID=A0A0A2T562_9BACI|nr:hypothetical protein [Pontibacillus yanchengensis]KGP70897.1 hypothetical protein N782_03450 [Pontibacillus yanchengensis Y32]